jgi:hypothetical protein
LTGVNTGDFGIQEGIRQERFVDLIRELDHTEGIERFRISSIEPNLLTDEIIEFVQRYLDNTSSIDYKKELSLFEVPNFFPRDVSRKKDETNKPLKVVGVDPDSLEIVVEFDSISDAIRAGYTNVSQIISGKSDRQIANGLRWFKKDSFDMTQMEPLRMSHRGSPKAVICTETGEEFESISIAEATLRDRGIKISGSHITSVCKGRRKVAGGFSWKYK